MRRPKLKGKCEWCGDRPAVLIANIPGNAVDSAVCEPCLQTPKAQEWGWEEICYPCNGYGTDIEGWLPCNYCGGEGRAAPA